MLVNLLLGTEQSTAAENKKKVSDSVFTQYLWWIEKTTIKQHRKKD